MHPETVPEELRWLVPAAVGSDPVEWGVTLPEPTLRQIRELINGRAGGSLLIDANAGVRLER